MKDTSVEQQGKSIVVCSQFTCMPIFQKEVKIEEVKSTKLVEDEKTPKDQEDSQALIQMLSAKSIEPLTGTLEQQVTPTQERHHQISRLIEKGKQFQISLPSDTTPRSQIMTQLEEMEDESISLDEVIMLPMYDLNNLILEKIQKLQALLTQRKNN